MFLASVGPANQVGDYIGDMADEDPNDMPRLTGIWRADSLGGQVPLC